MAHGELSAVQLFGLLALILGAAKVGAFIAKTLGQPAVLGELLSGVVLGSSMLGLIDPHQSTLHFLAEFGVAILLFLIGLETDLSRLIRVGLSSVVVAITGVAAPFLLGLVIARQFGLGQLEALIIGASLTATSVGITARVLNDMGKLQDDEGQIILGAAIIDDVIGLVILAVVAKLAAGEELSASSVAFTTLRAFGFLAIAIGVGGYVVRPLLNLVRKAEVAGGVTTLAVILALGLAWLADFSGSAVIIGSFAAGLLLGRTSKAEKILHSTTEIGNVVVPVFFVAVGASVDLGSLNPIDPKNEQVVAIGAALIVVGILGKFIAGYSIPWFKGKKSVIGVGMIPRGEVGLIVAQMGLNTKALSTGLYSAITMMVVVTTFIAPPLLRMLYPREGRSKGVSDVDGVQELVSGD